MLLKHADVLGNLDGIPCADRDQANRRTLTAYLAEMQQEQKTADDLGLPADQVFTSTGHGATFQDLIKLQKALGDHNTYLLGFQPTQGQGHAITSYGNPDTATNVSTLIGGVSTNTGSLPEYMGYSQQLADQARRHGAVDVAAISWFGYDAPPSMGSPSAYTDGRAVDGAPALDSFQTGLRTTHDGTTPSRNTVIGHSYGTLLIGEAASHSHTLDADNIAFLGSPGVGVEHASDLHLTGVPPQHTANHVYTSRAAHDIIQYAPTAKNIIDDFIGLFHHSAPTNAGGIGTDPWNPTFGGHHFTSDPGPGGGLDFGGDVTTHQNTYFLRQGSTMQFLGGLIAGTNSADEAVS